MPRAHVAGRPLTIVEATEMAARVDAHLRRTQHEWDAHLTRVLSCRWSSPPTARSSTSPCPLRGTPLNLSRLIISSLTPRLLLRLLLLWVVVSL